MRSLVLLSCLLSALASFAQTASSSDPRAVSLAQQSVAALTGGAIVSDVTLSANAIFILGGDAEKGTATLLGKGNSESRVDLKLSASTRSDIRNVANGIPAGEWIPNGGKSVPYALHNSWTDASWFFPALSSLAQTANPSFSFQYVGQEQYDGATVQHIRVFQISPQDTSNNLKASLMSLTDFYLDASSFLPTATAFTVHPDRDMNTDLPVDVRFDQYETVNGIQIPFHIQRKFNGTLMLDFSLTTVVLNSGIPDSLFNF